MTLDSLPIVWLPARTSAVTTLHCEPCGRSFFNDQASCLLSFHRPSGDWLMVPTCWVCLEGEAATAFERGADQITVHVPTAAAIGAAA